VGMLLRYGGIANPISLQPRSLDEPCGMISGWVGEHGAATPLAYGLRGFAPLQQLAHPGVSDSRRVLKLQAGSDEPLILHGRDDVPVSDLILLGRTPLFATAWIHGHDVDDLTPGLAAECTGIHRERAAEGTGNSREELCRSQAPLHALLGDPRAGHTRLA